MLDVGTRWYWNGRHYTVLERRGSGVLIVPDETPGKPRKAKAVDWVHEDRLDVLVRDGRLLESGG